MMTKSFSLHMAVLLALVFGLAACSTKDPSDVINDNKPESPVNPTTPVTPSGDNNTVMVTPDGAVVNHGDISINFPAGTFNNDVKVTITDVKQGEVNHDYEASQFYKLTIPATTAKKLTISLKSDKLGDDVNFVMYSPGFATSAHKATEIESYPETTYDKGEYKMTIPPINNGEDPENATLTIGLGHIPTLNDTGANTTRGLGNANWALESGEVDGVKWCIYIGWKAWWAYDRATLNKMKAFAPKLNAVIKEAVHQIRLLGFDLEKEPDPMTNALMPRTIPFYFSKTENWGEHEQDWLNNNFWSCLNIGIPKILEANGEMTSELKQTVIHETLHYFQSDYDPRFFSFFKNGDNDYVTLQEMGSVWIEKFMNNGQLSADFQIKDCGIGATKNTKFRLGLSKANGDIPQIFTGEKPFADYGYSLGPLLYYLTTYGKTHGIGDKNVIELFQKCYSVETLVNSYTILEFLNSWTKDHNWPFFDGGNNIDDYYLKMFKGELIKGLSFYTLRHSSTLPMLKFISEFSTKTVPTGKIYPYGCEVTDGLITGFKDIDLSDKELVIKQEAPDVQTYLLLANSSDQTKVTSIKQHAKVAMTISEDNSDSIVISGKELEQLRGSNGEFDTGFFLLTTRTSCYTSFTGSIPSKLTVALRKATGNPTVTPVSLYFSAEGGTQKVRINTAGYERFGASVRSEGSGWCGVRAYVDNGCFVDISTQPNTSTEQRECIVDCYVTNYKNPTDAQKVKVPVRVVQDGKAEEVSGGGSDIIVTKMHAHAYCMMVQINLKEKAVGGNSVIEPPRLLILDENEVSFTQDGSTLHLSATINQSDQTQTFSCDIVDVTGTCESSRAVNARYTKTINNSSTTGSETIVFGEIPYNYGWFDSDGEAHLDYKCTGASGLKVSSFSKSLTSKNYIGEGSQTTTYQYVEDAENLVEIDFFFDYVKTDESTTRSRSQLQSIPWNKTTEAVVKLIER